VRRAGYAAVIGVSLGLAIAWFAGSLPEPLGVAVVIGVALGILWWALRQLAWARRMLREMRDHDG
jgi:hypothetical protein